jgi:hypothetical protein
MIYFMNGIGTVTVIVFGALVQIILANMIMLRLLAMNPNVKIHSAGTDHEPITSSP